MRMRVRMFSVICLMILIFTGIPEAVDNLSPYELNWPQWRGPYASGISPNGDPPVEWSESKNIKWKIEIPGKGHASPVIWGDQIFQWWWTLGI